MAVEIFRNAAGRAAYLAAYDALLRRWPVAVAPVDVETPFGTTHLNVAGAPDAPPLVLLPGVSVGSVAWFANVGDLAARFRLYAVDIIGDAGRSVLAAPVARAADYAAWLAAVFDRLGLDHPALLGHSYGGWLALTLARRRPERVGRLAVIAPAAAIQPFRPVMWMMLRLAAFLPVRPDARRVLAAQAAPGFPLDADFVALMDAVSRHCWPKVLFPTRLSDAELRRLATPTLLILADGEVLFDAEAAAARARRLIPDVTVVRISGASHLVPLEKASEVDAAVLRFLTADSAR